MSSSSGFRKIGNRGGEHITASLPYLWANLSECIRLPATKGLLAENQNCFRYKESWRVREAEYFCLISLRFSHSPFLISIHSPWEGGRARLEPISAHRLPLYRFLRRQRRQQSELGSSSRCSESTAHQQSALMNVGLPTGSWQRLRTALERNRVAVWGLWGGQGTKTCWPCGWGTVCAGRGLMEGILVSLVLFRPSPRPWKALTLLIERESFWGRKCQQC